ncbi:MAG: hypothetical protein HYU62_04415 [Caulobacterales bacterium]|nr:hypothetical protein [Caulobacterales bacterium]
MAFMFSIDPPFLDQQTRNSHLLADVASAAIYGMGFQLRGQLANVCATCPGWTWPPA